MPTRSSQPEVGDRRPAVYRGKRVPGLFVRLLVDGSEAYDFRLRLSRGGKAERGTLKATNISAAMAELEAVKVDRRRGVPIKTSTLVPTVQEVAADWLADFEARTHLRDPKLRRSPRTYGIYAGRSAHQVIPLIGHLPINEVGALELRRMVTRLSQKPELSPSTVAAILRQTSSMFTFAVKHGLISANPVRSLPSDDRPSGRRQSEPRYLSMAQVGQLLSRMTDTFRPVAATAAYAGLRISEILALRWPDLDFDGKTITVSKQLDGDGTIRPVTKSRASTATVPMLPVLERELKAYRSRQAEKNLQLVQKTGLVFQTSRGRHHSRRNALRAVQHAAEVAGLHGEGLDPVGLHDLRHSFIALALDNGATLPEASLLARHANPQITAQVYAGVVEEKRAKIAAKLVAGGFGA